MLRHWSQLVPNNVNRHPRTLSNTTEPNRTLSCDFVHHFLLKIKGPCLLTLMSKHFAFTAPPSPCPQSTCQSPSPPNRLSFMHELEIIPVAWFLHLQFIRWRNISTCFSFPQPLFGYNFFFFFFFFSLWGFYSYSMHPSINNTFAH